MAWDSGGVRATRVAAFVASFSWWAGLVVGVGLVASLLAAPVLHRAGLIPQVAWSHFRVDDGGGPPRIAAAVEVVGDTGATVLPVAARDTGRVASPELRRGTVLRLEVGTRRWSLFYLAAAPLVATVAAALWVLYLLRAVLRDVLAERVFTARNAGRLSTVGWILLVAGIIWPPIVESRALLVLRQVHADGARLVPADVGGGGVWVVGLLVLALASAWRYGVELQRDRDLTV